MNPINELFRLFFPETCVGCGNSLPDGSRLLCPDCKWELPLTGYLSTHSNPVFERFGGLLPVEEASSYIFFGSQSRYRTMIHSLKYHGQWRIAQQLGSWIGEDLQQSELYSTIDIVVPIPLHTRRLLSRGYNQSQYLASGIAQQLEVPLSSRNVVRSSYNRSQVKTKHTDRWDNVKGIFSVRKPETLAGKHILLVDDMLTTGATIISCGVQIKKIVPDCRLSIVTLGVSSNELFGRKGGI